MDDPQKSHSTSTVLGLRGKKREKEYLCWPGDHPTGSRGTGLAPFIAVLVPVMKDSAVHNADPALTRERRRRSSDGGRSRLPGHQNSFVENKAGRNSGLAAGVRVTQETWLKPGN